MNNNAFKIGIAFAVMVGLLVIGFEGGGFGRRMGVLEKDPVLVFVVPSAVQLRNIHSALPAESLYWEGPEGLALRSGRVVALNLDQAGDVIQSAGWIDRPIQIVRLDEPKPDSGGFGDPEARAEIHARLRTLINKPSLTRGEQMFVLQAMHVGVEL